MPIYTVSQISEAIKKTLEGSFPILHIKGEISNLRYQSSGHYYFSLKDESSQLSCALFRTDALKLKSPLKDGDQIVAIGSLSVFTPRGAYQLIVKSVEMQGLGELLLKFEALKQKLAAKGYFNPERKKNLPKFPKTLGVITSPTGAVIQDILHTLQRRYKGFSLLLCPSKVQGEGAKEEIVQALEFMNKHKLCDVILLARGGGSLEDLWAFNEESVVDAVYRSLIPVISAIGHETDFTLCDFVADKRAPTPTAAAEMASPELSGILNALELKFEAIAKLFIKKIEGEKRLLTLLKKRPELSSPAHLFQTYYLHLDMIESKLKPLLHFKLSKNQSGLLLLKARLGGLSPIKKLEETKIRLLKLTENLHTLGREHLIGKRHPLEAYKQTLLGKMQNLLQTKKHQFSLLTQLLHSLDPLQVLDKGYAMIYDASCLSVITSVDHLNLNQDFRVYLKDGHCYAKVTQISPKVEAHGE